jgi:hypothetical protein
MSRLVTTVRVLPVAVALTCLAAADLDLPSDEFWRTRQSWLYLCLVVAFFVSAASESLSALNLRSQAAAIRAFETEIEAATATTMMRLTAHLGLAADQVGVHVFYARGHSLPIPWAAGRLVLVGRLRIGGKPSMHRPRWSRGKGIVGRAWQNGKYVAEDWEAVRRLGETMDQEKWNALPDDERYGMSWSELQASAGYRLIAARPIFDLVNQNDRVLGCVAVDAQCGLPGDHRELQSILADLANSVEAIEPPPKAWLNQRRLGY